MVRGFPREDQGLQGRNCKVHQRMEGIRRVYRHYCELSMFVQLLPLPENWLACDRFHPGIMIASTAAAFLASHWFCYQLNKYAYFVRRHPDKGSKKPGGLIRLTII